MTNQDKASWRIEVVSALATARAHPAVQNARITSYDGQSGAAVLELDIGTELPSRWHGEGRSPSGVRPIETVVLELPSTFPNKPPHILLRQDFNRSLPHINPHQEGERVPPCVYWGDLGELMHRSGLGAVITQIADWLERAAFETLINEAQGWEAVRRDSTEDSLVFDPNKLEKHVTKAGGAKYLSAAYLDLKTSNDERFVFALLHNQQVALNPKTIDAQFEIRPQGRAQQGKSIAILAWPGKLPSGQPMVCSEYLPETVRTYKELLLRADKYGCGKPLREHLKWLWNCLAHIKRKGSFPIFIILCARRPFRLIDSDSTVELLPYRLDVSKSVLPQDRDNLRVQPMGHRVPISIDLLRRMSDVSSTATIPVYTILGCGSLGSKIALHLARAGLGPSHVIDKKGMSPHNSARHALPPPPQPFDRLATSSKSRALASLLTNLGQEVKGHDLDILETKPNTSTFRRLLGEQQACIVNTTASYSVREYLGATLGISSRVVEAAILSSGKAGILTFEGPARNPNCLDLGAELYELMRENRELRTLLLSEEPARAVLVGQGCGSPTMRMSDAKISMYSAAMSERLTRAFTQELPRSGEIMLGQLEMDGLSLMWRSMAIAPSYTIAAENDQTWTIRIANRAHQRIVSETSSYPHVETGGVIFGRVLPLRKSILITNAISGPPDSIRSASKFVLGTQNLTSIIEDYQKDSANLLWCLGTWHSHLADQGGSPRDYATARQIAASGQSPALLLIRRPTGYSAIVEATY